MPIFPACTLEQATDKFDGTPLQCAKPSKIPNHPFRTRKCVSQADIMNFYMGHAFRRRPNLHRPHYPEMLLQCPDCGTAGMNARLGVHRCACNPTSREHKRNKQIEQRKAK